jgi:subfamily B ATP-binding cassette protein MsbA
MNTNMRALNTYFRLLKSVKPYWLIFSIGILATIGASGIDAILVWAVKPIIDAGLVAQNTIFLKWLPIFIVIIFVMRGLVNLTSMYCVSRVGCSIVMDYRQQVFAHMLKLPAQFYDQESSGKLLSLLLYNISQIASAATDNLITIVSEGSLAIGMIVVMLAISWHLTLFFIVFTPVVSGIIHIMTKRQRKLSFTVQDSMADVTHIARESIEGYKIIRTFNGEEYEEGKFNKATLKNRHRELKVVITNALGTSSVQIVIAIPMALLIYIVGMSHLGISVGGFGAMIGAVLRLLTPLRRLTRVSTTIQKGIAGSVTVFEMLDTPTEKDTGIKPLTSAQGKIEYRNVTFNYAVSPNIIVLQNINFTVQPGQIVALVGHSGAGKSTLVNLLPRFYDVEHGEILIDDVNIKDYHLADLRKQFSFVSQQITLFNDTIGRNIAYGRIFDANEEEIFAAAKAAYILDFIRELPDGINTLIGENGLMLSGGQRQRVAIARAILKNAPILILDEATSSLDTESEQYLKAALEKLMSKRTTLVIAHRLSTVEKADRILVLDHGKIIEDGTHKQLIAADTYYSKLYRLQFNE